MSPAWGRWRTKATGLRGLGCQWALLKGGHLTNETVSVDYLAGPDGISTYTSPRIETLNDHGTGCTLSSAITALLPDHTVPESVERAKTYLHGALVASDRLDVGQGHGPLHHFHQLWPRG